MKKILKKIIDKLTEIKMLNKIWGIIGNGIVYLLNKMNGVVLFYNTEEQQKVFSLIKAVKNENHLLLSDNEAYQIYMAVKKTSKIDGNIAEVGTYMGASAKIVCEAKGKKHLYLFDTFEGLPKSTFWDTNTHFREGDFKATYDYVKDYLKKYENISLHKGFFPDTATPIENEKFSFVHIDVDLYESTLACINFFYERMSKGGIIISHDYDEPGVRKAIDDFFENKPELVIELPICQCLIVKL